MASRSDGGGRGGDAREDMAVEMSSDDARMRAEWEDVRRQRKELEKKAGVRCEDDDNDDEQRWLMAVQAQSTTDPFACFCRCGFKKIGQSYVLREKRIITGNLVTRELIVVGPHWVGVVVTLSIIVCCTGLFVHQQCALLPWYYTVLTLGFCGMTLYYLYGVACKDPGFVRPRRAEKVYPQRQTKPTKTVLMEDDDDSDADSEKAKDAAEEDEDGDLETGNARARVSVSRRSPSSRSSSRSRYCDICEIAQDLYTEHCEDCGVCIEDYDHHCPWMGKCIGKNNMHAFKMFNLSWVLYVIFVLAVSIQNVDWGDAAVQRLHRLSTGEWVPMTKTPHLR